MSSRTNPDNELGLNVSFYIENASTGRFRRCLGDSDRDTRSSSSTIPTRQNTVVAEDESDGVIHHVLPLMTKAAFICFLFLQGILSGLSLSAVYEALTPQRTEEFFAQYSAARANEIRRYFFIGITLCATGSLCSINKNDATQVLYIMIGGSSPNSTTKASASICYLILTYFLALIITIVCSHEDVRLLQIHIATQFTEQNIHTSTDNFLTVFKRWRGLSVSRSVFCIVGWLISCYRFVISRNSAQRDG